jgi:predicted small integral membrane protein
MAPLIDLEASDEEAQAIKPERVGFLPIHTNGFDRGFIGVVLFIAIHLFWMRFLEQWLPLVIATVLSLLLAVFIVARG